MNDPLPNPPSKPRTPTRRIAGCLITAVLVFAAALAIAISVPYLMNALVPRRPAARSQTAPAANPETAASIDHAGPTCLAAWPSDARPVRFSPDSRTIAYLWKHTTERDAPEGGRGWHTLTDKAEVRWFPTKDPSRERTVFIDSFDIRPKGSYGARIDVSMRFSPDSKHLAVVCARRIIVVDLDTGRKRTWEYPGEKFGDANWLSNEEIGFSTWAPRQAAIWRARVEDPPGNRRQVYARDPAVPAGSSAPPTASRPLDEFNPWSLGLMQWSPNGRYAFVNPIFTSESQMLLDLLTGRTVALPIDGSRFCWKGDSSACVVQGFWGGSAERKCIFLETASGQVTDLTDSFNAAFKQGCGVALVSDFWTPDGLYVILYDTVEGFLTDGNVGYIIQPHPFRVIHRANRILWRTPIPGWVLRQSGSQMNWMTYDGARSLSIDGWPNDWSWSPDGRRAAKIEDNKVVVIHPNLPE